MRIVAFDESHGETWTISKEDAVRASPLAPEYRFYGHLVDAISLDADLKCVRISQKWTESALDGIHVLVIAHPASADREGRACDGIPSFNEDELRTIERFLKRGGGLLVISEYEADSWENNLNDLIARYGIQCNNDTVLASLNDYNSHILVPNFVCTDFGTHPVTSGLASISYHRGCSLKVHKSAQPVIFSPDHIPLAAICEVGRGRVAVVGDSDLFSIPFIGGNDNARLFTNLVSWLSDIQQVGNELPYRRPLNGNYLDRAAYNFRVVDHNRDLAAVPGEHFQPTTVEESARIHQAIENDISPYECRDEFLDRAELLFHAMPARLRRAVSQFKRSGNQHGAMLVRGLPIDENVPATPANSRRAPGKKTFVSEAMLAAFSRALGEPYAYHREKSGELFQNICPVKENLDKLSSESATSLLDFHTETAFHPFLPDFLLLFCLRADHDNVARTEVASSRNIIPLLKLRDRAILFEPLFRTGIDYSFGSANGLKGNGPTIPVFYGNPYDPFMKYDLDLMKGTEGDAEKALSQIRVAANAAKNFVKLQPGDLLIIDNRRSVHSRTIFMPRFDGHDRWLQRAFVRLDLVATEELRVTRDRVIELEFRV